MRRHPQPPLTHRWTCRELRATYHTINTMPQQERPILASPLALAPFIAPLYRDLPSETIGVLGLDARLRPIAHATIGKGSIDGVITAPREFFVAALLMNAAEIVVIHNHPSGDARPSPDDRTCAETLQTLGAMMHCPVRDFLIIGEQECYSLMADALIVTPRERARKKGR